MPVLHPRPFFLFFLHLNFFLHNLTFIYVSAIYCLVLILFLEYFELSIWKEKKRNRHGVTKLVIFMFFYEHHFFYIFAQTRLLGTIVDATNQKKLSRKSAHLFSLASFGVTSNGRIKSHTSFENLFSSGFIICNRF